MTPTARTTAADAELRVRALLHTSMDGYGNIYVYEPRTQAEEVAMKGLIQPRNWPIGDTRRCAACGDGGQTTGYRNSYAVVWKCRCGGRVAEVWFERSAKYRGGLLQKPSFESFMGGPDDEIRFLCGQLVFSAAQWVLVRPGCLDII